MGWYYLKASDQSQKYKEGKNPSHLSARGPASKTLMMMIDRKVPARKGEVGEGQRMDTRLLINQQSLYHQLSSYTPHLLYLLYCTSNILWIISCFKD